MADRTVVVLGCGVAGLAAVRELRRLLPEARIIVIERAPMAAYAPSFPALAVGEVRAATIRRSWGPLARRGIELVNAPLQSIDLESRQVRAESRLVRYDQLIIALGAEPAPDLVPGLVESSQSFGTLEGAERLAATLRYFAGGRVLIALPEGPSRWPPAAYELAMVMEHHFHRKKMRQKVEITLATAEATPLGYLGAEVSDLVAGQLAHKGIEFAGGSALLSVEQGHHIARFSDGVERPFDLLIASLPLRAPNPAIEAGLAEEGSWIPVGPDSVETSRQGVFVAGNASAPGGGAGGLSWSAAVAAQAGRLAAREIAGDSPRRHRTGRPQVNGRLFIEVGAGAAFMVSGDLSGRTHQLSVTQPSIVWHWAKTVAEKRWRYERW